MTTADDGPLLRCERLVVGHGGRPLLPPIDLAIDPGRFTVVAGRNGAGKTTWLRTVLGLQPPISGRVVRRRPAPRLAYVPQAASLDAVLPVRARAIVGWGRLRGWRFLSPLPSRADVRARERAVVEADAEAFAGRCFRDLSGGQRQRTLFARTLAGEAELAILDEPTASMDAAAETDAYRRLAGLARDRGVAVVVVTHTLAAAARHADEVVFFDVGDGPDGAVVETGPPSQVFAHPTFVRHFGGAPADDG